MKHKIFFWLLLMDCLSTRDLLIRKQEELDSYTCDLCLRRKLEIVSHLFLRCNFYKGCWTSIGVSVITTRPMFQIFKSIKDKLWVPFFMEIIVLMSWSIWTTRNIYMFNDIDPQVQVWKRKFLSEFSLLLHMVRPDEVLAMETQMNLL